MKLFRSSCLFFLLFTAITVSAWASPVKDEDFGYWNVTDLEHKFNDKWKMKAGEEVRLREHAGINYYDTHAGFAYQTHPLLVLGADYIQARQTRSSGKKDVWYWESRPRIYATFQPKYKGFLFENRNLLEFRFKESIENTTRYRNLSTLTAPWKWTRFEFQPYTSNELFFETNRNGLVEDRYYTGFKLRLTKNITGSIFYLRQFSKNNSASWKDLNVLGNSLKFSF